MLISYGFHPFDICFEQPELWNFIKYSYPVVSTFTMFLFLRHFYYFFISLPFLSKKVSSNSHKASYSSTLSLFIGYDEESDVPVSIPESGLFQNFLITGTIGSGKTSSVMFPFTRQLIEYNAEHSNNKIGMLILDVKGNYHHKIQEFTSNFGLEKDLFVLSLNHSVYYNPLHKPNLKPQVLANRLKTILTLFSPNHTESYWLDKAEQLLTECIKLCRMYNSGYVTFLEIHKLITSPSYFEEKIAVLKKRFLTCELSQKEVYELNSCLDFFQQDFNSLDDRTRGILISEVSRITTTFLSDYDVSSVFCPPKEKLNFYGFSDLISHGKILVLNINISEYSVLSRMISAYLKLDFQTEVMSCLAHGNIRKTVFLCDEYDKFCTKTDADFFSMSREAKCINIVSTQSYSSLKHTLRDDASVKVVTQNLINKIWFRTDDLFTIEEAQKQLGKEDKEKISESISENAKETRYNYLTRSFLTDASNLSESYSRYYQNEYIYDSNFFTQELSTFYALTFLSDGFSIYSPKKLKMKPYFQD